MSKSVKLSTQEALRALDALESWVVQELPSRLAMAIRSTIRELASIADDYNKERAKLIEKFSQKDANGETVSNQDGVIVWADEEAVNVAYAELIAAPNEISRTLKASVIADSDIPIKPQMLLLLGDLIQD